MRPSVSRATWWPRFCSTPSDGVSACSSGIPLADGPWSRMTTTTSRSSSRRENAVRNADLVGEHPGGRLDHAVLGGDRRHLDHGVAEGAAEHPQATVGRERLGDRAQHVGVAGDGRHVAARPARRPRRAPASAGSGSDRGRPASARPRAAARRRSACRPGTACRRRRGSGSRRRGRWGTSGPAAGRPADRSSKSSQVSCTPAAAAIVTRCMVWLVEPPVASSATTPLTTHPLVDDVTDAVDVVAGGDLGDPAGGGVGQRGAQRAVRVHERGAGQVQAHDVHQQLVGVGGAVERAGAGRVVGRDLGGEQVLAADLAVGVRATDRGLLGVRQPARTSGRPGPSPWAGARTRGHRRRGRARSCRRRRASARRRRRRGTGRSPSDIAMTSRLNRLSSMPARPWVMPSHMAGTPPATRATPPIERAVSLICCG